MTREPVENLEVWLQQQKTEPVITKVLCAKLLRWQSGGQCGSSLWNACCSHAMSRGE
jgi:hypothetical protein